jgi:hypothetical protein
MSELSPAAEAVFDALNMSELNGPQQFVALAHAAAALRAAADQVVPEYETTPGGSKIWPSEPVPSIRAGLLAIADELEAQ